MMSPFTFTSTCSMISPLDDARGDPELVERSARIGATADTARTIAATKCCFFISFNILAYLNAFAQVTQQARNPAEHAPFGPRVFLGRPEDLVAGEPRGDLAGRRPGRPPGGRRAPLLQRIGQPYPQVQLQSGRRSQLDVLALLNDPE